MGEYAEVLLFPYDDMEALAERLLWMLRLPLNEAERIGTYLRAQVVALHSLNQLAEKLQTLFRCVKEGKA
jgi:glycosyltransferase involved in cell wall biosynthesis